jgi:hypothetical protein
MQFTIDLTTVSFGDILIALVIIVWLVTRKY